MSLSQSQDRFSYKDYQNPEGGEIELYYTTTKAESETVAQQFLGEPVLGFDMEWVYDPDRRPESMTLKENVSLIQLASKTKIALFHIALHAETAPEDLIAPSLKVIIESPHITKAGVSIMHGDFSRLVQFLRLKPQGALELSQLHNLVTNWPYSRNNITTLLCKMDSQVATHLKKKLVKDGGERASNWSQPLTVEQKQYAADDVYASFMLYHRMNEKREQMAVVPPLPEFCEKYLPFGLAPYKEVILLRPIQEGEKAMKATDDALLKAAKDQSSALSNVSLSRQALEPESKAENALSSDERQGESVGGPGLSPNKFLAAKLRKARETLSLHGPPTDQDKPAGEGSPRAE